jgi:hypothetical protein
MFATAARANGDRDPLEQATQQVTSDERDADESHADCQMFTERSLEAEPREHDDLRDHREAVADRDISHRLDQRHQAGLFHAASR